MIKFIDANLESFVPLTYSRRGVQRLTTISAVANDTTFLVGLSRAFYWQSLLDAGVMKSGSEIAKNEGLHHSVVNELMRLTLLAPDIITQLMPDTTKAAQFDVQGHLYVLNGGCASRSQKHATSYHDQHAHVSDNLHASRLRIVADQAVQNGSGH